MSQFFQDLWQSIFTPGPTPTLLVATNVTFACLQLLFAGLLVATFSVHFVVLSALSAGLWWGINWFAAELKAAQAREEAADREAKRLGTGPVSPYEDSETEVETVGGGADDAPSGSNEVEPIEPHGELKHRLRVAEESSQGNKSSASTEDEWEKVSESEDAKDK